MSDLYIGYDRAKGEDYCILVVLGMSAPFRPTKRALKLGQCSSWSHREGAGRQHLRVWPDGSITKHFDRFDPDRSWLHALAHLFVDMVPWLLKGRPR